MSREATFVAWATPGTLLVLVAVYVVVGRAERYERAAFRNALAERSDSVATSIKSLQVQMLQAMGRVEGLQRSTLQQLEAITRGLANNFARHQDVIDPADIVQEAASTEDLPPLGEDVDPMILKSLSVSDLIGDPRFNPDGVQPSRLGKAEIYGALLVGRQELERIEHRRRLAVIEAADEMERNGEYVHYGLDETPIPAGPGVLSAGMPTPQGTQIFYFAPERFEALYGLKGEENQMASLQLRRAIKHLRNEE